MKRKHLWLFLAAPTAIASILIACNKDSSNPLTTRQKQLTAKAWIIKQISTPSTDGTKDSSILKPCHLQSLSIFSTDGSFNLQDKAGNCDSTSYPYDKGLWGLYANEDSLYLQGNKKKQYIKLVQITDSTLQIRFRDSINPTTKVLKTVTYGH